MSLYLGNLSAHVHREELEWVFQEFGQCEVRLKDGYGFVVYNVPTNAERALRALKGKTICREHITLTWSNKQPRNFQKFSRPNRFYEPHHGTNIRENNNNLRTRSSHDRRDFMRPSANNHREPHPTNERDKERGYTEYVDNTREENDQNSNKALPHGDHAPELYPVENSRWGEPVSDSPDGNRLEHPEFERYKPKHDYDGGDGDVNRKILGSYDSLAGAISPDKGRRENISDPRLKHQDNQKPHLVCYNCGLLGHIMRNCPRGNSSRPEKFRRFHGRKDNDDDMGSRGRGDGRLRRVRTTTWARSNNDRDTFQSGHHTGDSSQPHSRSAKRFVRKRDRDTESKDDSQSEPDTESPEKKISRRKHGSKKQLKKRTRMSSLSSLHSDSTKSSSRSQSVSARSVSRSSSHSRSRSLSKPRPHSSISRSGSVSSDSKSGSPRSRASLNPSLSISLEKKPASSPKIFQSHDANGSSLNGHMKHVSSPRSRISLVHDLEYPESKDAMEADIVDTSFKASDVIHGKYPGDGEGDANFSTVKPGLEERDLSMAPLENMSFTSEKISENIAVKNDLNEAFPAKLDMHFAAECHTRSSTRTSPEEMCAVLKHYGLKAPEECESGFSVEDYFGAARLWPWEIIYYRRLKKGPISTENYARRVAQNLEFGIVDKYIRSSSGWGE